MPEAGGTKSAAARAEILGRIRAGLAASGATEPPAPAPPPGARAADRVEHFTTRVSAYRATVHRTEPPGVPDTVAAILARHGAHRLAVPAGLPAAWLPAELDGVGDEPPLSVRELDRLDGVLTASALAIAETGTVVLDHGPGQGRRALSLLPDLHICVVDAATIVDDVPDAMAALAEPISAGRPVTFISGPSATSDIELNRVEGVHGPRLLEIILLDTPPHRPAGG
jgi:L-lactate dehydrogenase complex protein LldG